MCVCVCKCVSGCVWFFWYFCYDNNDINNNLFITYLKNCNIDRQSIWSLHITGLSECRPGRTRSANQNPTSTLCMLPVHCFPMEGFYFLLFLLSKKQDVQYCWKLWQRFQGTSGHLPQPRMSCQKFLPACWEHRANPEVATVAVHLHWYWS